MRNEIAAGSKTDQAVNAIWAAMVYHTPALNHALKTYGNPWLLSVVTEQTLLYLFSFLLYFMFILHGGLTLWISLLLFCLCMSS